MKVIRKHPISGQGFSLIEMLAAIAVLSILAMIIVQLTGATSRSVQLSNRPVDAAAQARLALDRLAADLNGLVRRPDCDFSAATVSSGSGNLLQFFSMVGSAGLSKSTNRNISLVAYQIAAHPDNHNLPCLQRAGMPVDWTQTGFFGLKSNGLPIRFTDVGLFPQALLPQGTSDYDVLAPGVIQMAVGFKLRPDNNPVTLADSTQIGNAQGQIVYSLPIRLLTPLGGGAAVPYVDITRISALEVYVVALDVESLKLLNSASQFTDLANKFTIPKPTDTQPLLQTWSGIANNASSMPTSIPLQVRQAVRIFVRSFPINLSANGQP